jgi:uncharacterized protein YdhG (YjbR/CyaY superfamily)
VTDTQPLTVAEYIEQYPQDIQEILFKLRGIIKILIPNSEELIRWGMPSYYLNGHPFLNFAAQKKHLGFYGTIPEPFIDKLKAYKCTKTGIQFPYKQPIPYNLITEIINYKKGDCHLF